MPVLYANKISNNENIDYVKDKDFSELDYPIFLATVSEPKSKIGLVCDWLEPQLGIIQEQWQEWQNSKKLKDIPNVRIFNKKQEKKGMKKPELFSEEMISKKEKTKK
jgi:hypothetical protein